ncbi:hypothetical protein BU16DRAFT_603038 [Lophium mytilinum]|uniref:Uncharacterized protein n=1 Tax=Lophium mytilinum TaxID=390894 RepID=A0A6A6R2R8_9PEZI|nr:hypothetical protein BU16DRAFT_603038 [Lophium mytilinum]
MGAKRRANGTYHGRREKGKDVEGIEIPLESVMKEICAQKDEKVQATRTICVNETRFLTVMGDLDDESFSTLLTVSQVVVVAARLSAVGRCPPGVPAGPPAPATRPSSSKPRCHLSEELEGVDFSALKLLLLWGRRKTAAGHAEGILDELRQFSRHRWTMLRGRDEGGLVRDEERRRPGVEEFQWAAAKPALDDSSPLASLLRPPKSLADSHIDLRNPLIALGNLETLSSELLGSIGTFGRVSRSSAELRSSLPARWSSTPSAASLHHNTGEALQQGLSGVPGGHTSSARSFRGLETSVIECRPARDREGGGGGRAISCAALAIQTPPYPPPAPALQNPRPANARESRTRGIGEP